MSICTSNCFSNIWWPTLRLFHKLQFTEACDFPQTCFFAHEVSKFCLSCDFLPDIYAAKASGLNSIILIGEQFMKPKTNQNY